MGARLGWDPLIQKFSKKTVKPLNRKGAWVIRNMSVTPLCRARWRITYTIYNISVYVYIHVYIYIYIYTYTYIYIYTL